MFEALWFALILSVAILSGCFYKYWLAFSYQSGQLPVWTEATYASAIVVFSYLVLKIYCATWKSLSAKRGVVRVYEGVLVPALALCMPVLISFRDLSPKYNVAHDIIGFPVIAFGLAYLLLSDTFGIFRRGINDLIIVPYGSGIENLSVNNPPTCRADIWPVDILLNGFWLSLLAVQLYKHL